ncbi:MAG: DNA/pantothenate metabolism flavoprotein domain protein [Verrucomicrobiae bacterium]|nr:DNA/pantothenate metabolism flavoprotein domain protein [Verrucomicrobiae bacterium]
MRCIVTAGPTYEPMDEVRRLTNFSTGRLGTELANFLVSCGHHVTLLRGEQATYSGEGRAQTVEAFSTTDSLRTRLRSLADPAVGAVFHAAAVSDFAFGKIWLRSPDGELSELKSGKISTRQGALLAELVPTPKILAELRAWYPTAKLLGWKYEVDGDQAGVLRAAELQLTTCLTDVCVANGPAYGPGFGLVAAAGARAHAHLVDEGALFERLASLLRA